MENVVPASLSHKECETSNTQSCATLTLVWCIAPHVTSRRFHFSFPLCANFCYTYKNKKQHVPITVALTSQPSSLPYPIYLKVSLTNNSFISAPEQPPLQQIHLPETILENPPKKKYPEFCIPFSPCSHFNLFPLLGYFYFYFIFFITGNMTRLFRSKSCGVCQTTSSMFNSSPPSPSRYLTNGGTDHDEDEEEEEEEDEVYLANSPVTTPFIISPDRRFRHHHHQRQQSQNHLFPILDILAAVLRKSLVTCSVERDDVSSMDIGWPTNVRHVSHVTFDRFNGFLGLPVELELPLKVPSASASVFGVSANSMQCSYDQRGNSVPMILLLMQKHLYLEGGLQAEGIFRINAENSQEEYVRNQLNKGVVPHGIDVHCLAGLIKAWFRELPAGVLDSLTPEQVMHCNTENECAQLVKLLPPTEAALLDWAINLMADVVQHENHNKMNARNIAMVFAPNMTQMADPLTALIHAVQVMNFLKTLIMKTLREREESAAQGRLLPSCTGSPWNKGDSHSSNASRVLSSGQTFDGCASEGPAISDLFRSATIGRLERDDMEKFWSFQSKNDTDEGYESISDRSSPVMSKRTNLENGSRGEYNDGEVEGIFDRLNLKKGVRKICRHPVFHLSKPAKKTRGVGIVNSREGGEEAWA